MIGALLKSISDSGVTSLLSPALARRLKLTNLYSFSFAIITLSYGLFFIWLKISFMGLMTIPFVLGFLLVVIANRAQLYRASRVLTMIVSYLVNYFFSTSLGRNSAVHNWYFVTAILPFVIFELSERIFLVTFSVLTIAVVSFLWVTQFQFGFVPQVTISAETIHLISSTMIAVSLTTVVVMLFFISYAYDRSFQLQIKTRRLLENYAKALDASCIVAFTDPRGVITYVNDKFCEVSGYSRQELIGKTHSILNSGHHSADFFGDMWRTISSKCIWKGEVCNITKKGSLYWVDTTIIPMLDEQSQLEQYVALRYETTQRKVAEQMSIQSAKLASLGEKVRITVMDSGNGIPESIANKLMQPFFTTKEVGKGTGLGLSISKGIIESHGGKFELDRNASHTSFVIEIPTKQKRS